MLCDSLVTGIGIGKFKALFNENQANYFSTRYIDSKRALLADNTFYAFNDYLQWVIETGFTGLLLLVLFLYLTASRINHLLNAWPDRPVVNAVSAALVCAAIAALFSYPLQVIPIQALVLLCLCIIAFYPLPKRDSTSIQKAGSFAYKLFMLVLVVLFVRKSGNEYNEKEMEREAFHLARTGYKETAIKRYEQLLKKFPASGYNWYFYAKQLYYSNRLQDAYISVKRGIVYYVDNNVYALKAAIENELGLYPQAEKSYLRALYMVPNRMGSRLDLVRFYCNQKDTVKAIHWAKSIINMPIKVPSEKTDRMLQETKLILKKLQH